MTIRQKMIYIREMEGRKIIHVDMDAFYASVEQRDNPRLRGKPVVVGGSADNRGVVASCSYEARRFGVRSAMSSRRAASLCPGVIFVRPRMEKYKEVSHQIRALFHAVTPLVEPLSLDEAYLDVTTNLIDQPSATRIAQLLRHQIKTELGLTASAGVGPNKFIAKVASDIKKPDGLTVITPAQAMDFVAKLPVERFWGVGPATAKRLHDHGIKTGADLRALSPVLLSDWLGKFGVFLHRLANAEDHRVVSPDRKAKSRGAETTFSKDVLDFATLERTLLELSEDVADSINRLDKDGRCIVLKVKYGDFTSVTRSRTIDRATRDAKTIAEIAGDLLRTTTDAGKTPIRLLGVSIKLPDDPSESDEDSGQLELEAIG